MKKFKPQLAPNIQLDIKDLPLPLLASYKYDGLRCIFKDGEMLTRSLKQFPNVRLREKFAPIAEFCGEQSIILDGELYDPTINFPELSGLCRRLDEVVPDTLKFYCFDCIPHEDINLPFSIRYAGTLDEGELRFPGLCKHVVHTLVKNSKDIEEYFQKALDEGFEGLILRDPKGRYKFGRGTLREGLIFKLKPYESFDAKIIGIVQATKVDPNAEKKINELGYSETSKKKDDRILIEKACDFVVMHEGKKELKVMIAATDEEKKEIWKNRESYLNRYIEYKGFLIGSKMLPRHPVFLRMRPDKD